MKIVIERGNLMKKFLNIFLVFAMIFSMVFQSSGRASAQEYPNNVITGARITDLSDQPITGNNIGAWRAFRVHATYALPDHAVHDGDKTILTLPVGFAPATPFTFDVKAGDEVVAKGKLIDGSPVKLELTYTNYVDTHSGVNGTFFFNLQINSQTQSNTGNIPVTLTAQDGHVTDAGTVPFNPKKVTPTQLIKSGWMDSQDKTIGHYKINVNQNNKAMTGAVLVDKLLTPGVEYVKGSVQVFEGKWVSNPTGTDVVFDNSNPTDITSQFTNKISIQGNRLYIAIGNRPSGKGLQIRYKTKISYEPVVGEEFKNEAELDDGGEQFKHNASYKILGAGGSSEGYVYKIKVKKTNKNGVSLPGAEFRVKRDRNGVVVGTITSGEDGTGELGGLVKDNYKLEEVKAPQGYKMLTEPTIVEESDFSETDRTASKTITNEPETVDVTVTKAWVGPIGNSATVQLIKVDGPTETVIGEKVLNAVGHWKHIFKDLRKYEANGTPIEYTVKEKDVPQGYESKVTGSMEDGFKITNTNIEKTEVNVEKKWIGDTGNSVVAQVKKVGSETVLAEHELKASEHWKHTFTDLDKYATDGSLINYRVVEKTVPTGYEVSYDKDQTGKFIIKNTQKTINVKVEKKWENVTGDKPTIKLQLLKNGQAEGAPVEITNGTTNYTWSGLKQTDAQGQEYIYTVKEVDENSNYIQLEGNQYKVTYGGDHKTGLTVTNKKLTPLIPATRDVKVVKNWKDKAGNNITAPVDKVEVELFKDGATTGKKLELKKAEGWTATFKELPVSATLGGPVHKYTVKEVGETANTINFNGYTYNVIYKGDMKDGLTVVNEKKPSSPGGGGTGGITPPDPGVIGGGDRIETAIKISRRFYDKAKTVIVVRHDLFPDSMTASVLAKLKDAPILLNPTNKLDARVGAEIKRLGAEEVIIVGGPDSVSERVREELKVYDKDKNVERVSGVDRYGTSEMVARRVTGITGKKYTGVVASGQVFPDALSVGTFASREAYPILLVKKDTVPYQIERAIKDLDISKTYIAGGTSTIFKSTEAKLPGVLERMAGKDRYETSVAIAKSKFKDSKEAFIASGEEFADALVISPISGKYNKPTLLASRNKNTNAVVKKYIQDVGLTSITAIGGEKYLPYSVLLDLVGK